MGRAAATIAFGTVLVSSIVADDSPLERLNKRSADARWQQARDQWIPGEKQGAAQQIREETPVLTPSSVLPFQQAEQESPMLDTTLLDEGGVFEATIPLLDPPAEQFSAERLEDQAPVRMSAKPFPGESTSDLTSPARSLLVPDPYGLISEKGNEGESLAPSEVVVPGSQDAGLPRFVQRDAVLPPAPESESEPRKPVLRNISDIQPFYDYRPEKVIGEQAGFTSGQERTEPTYLNLPHSGELEKNFPPTYYHWMASNLTHDPLYFEDVSLERYGHTYPFAQPFVSVSKFGLQVVGLPYQMALNPIDSEQYALGNYRPGDCPPHLRYRIPFNKKAAATAAGVYTGLIFLIP
ncbi:hypothetical protein Mal48_34680 [Thalassoglobus polymorphus]|uniref:Uncharacterized protein n=2 Tax=Thalassoglobus polymorphus TaxID=2527994 RepID=A0A517QRG9_9PLAN|nr:hypothetical protein Mal48_34680 [Thalassoglobus polymorphus]